MKTYEITIREREGERMETVYSRSFNEPFDIRQAADTINKLTVKTIKKPIATDKKRIYPYKDKYRVGRLL